MRAPAFTLLCLSFVGVASVTQADVFTRKEIAQGKAKPQPKKSRAAIPGVTPEREAAVMTFVRQHHPDLVDLLVNLKTEDERSYGRAVRDLFMASERLAKSQEKDAERYELDLKAWKAKSRQQYLAAQIKMSDSPKLREQLRETLAEQADIQIMSMELERKRLADRLEQVKKNIARLRESKDKSVDRKFNQVVNSKPNKPASAAKPKPKRPAKTKD